MIIRRINESDRARIQEWILADAEHAAKCMTADFFFVEQTLCLCFCDATGPVFYVRLDPEMNGTVRVHIQFNPAQLLRTARMLKEGFPVVADRIKAAGAMRMVFDSVSYGLIDFCMNRFDFRRVAGTDDLELTFESFDAEASHVRS